MRPFASLMAYPEALAKALAVCRPVEGMEKIPLAGALGRVVAKDVLSQGDLPASARAAMDGYALASPGADSLVLVGHSHLGAPFRGLVPAGACAEIATGALMPLGTDAVVMVEETEREGDRVRFKARTKPGQNLSPPGEDFRAGDRILEAGALLHPGRLLALAACGFPEVEVRRRPGVAHATGGDEVVPPGNPLRGLDGVYDANSLAVSSLVGAHGGEAKSLGIVPDTIESLRQAVARAERADLVVFSGGTSVGPKDFTLDLLGEGSELIFRGVAVKPGRPTILGRLPSGALFLGLPGYPVSCLMMGYAFLVPMIRKMAGLPEAWGRRERLPLAEPLPETGRMHTFVPVSVSPDGVRSCFRKSSTTRSFSAAGGVVEIPAGTPGREKGESVEVRFLG